MKQNILVASNTQENTKPEEEHRMNTFLHSRKKKQPGERKTEPCHLDFWNVHLWRERWWRRLVFALFDSPTRMGRLHVSSGFSLLGCSGRPARKRTTGQVGIKLSLCVIISMPCQTRSQSLFLLNYRSFNSSVGCVNRELTAGDLVIERPTQKWRRPRFPFQFHPWGLWDTKDSWLVAICAAAYAKSVYLHSWRRYHLTAAYWGKGNEYLKIHERRPRQFETTNQ